MKVPTLADLLVEKRKLDIVHPYIRPKLQRFQILLRRVIDSHTPVPRCLGLFLGSFCHRTWQIEK